MLELEESGDLVITHVAPLELAERLRSKLIERWATEFADKPPDEVVIANGISGATAYVQNKFGLPYPQALSVVERFVSDLKQERTRTDLAELISHQGAEDIAMGAFFCVHLGGGEYYSPEYLTWRKDKWR